MKTGRSCPLHVLLSKFVYLDGTEILVEVFRGSHDRCNDLLNAKVNVNSLPPGKIISTMNMVNTAVQWDQHCARQRGVMH